MHTELDCLPCFTRQALDALRLISCDQELQWRVMKKVLRAAAQFSAAQQPPEMAQIIHHIIRLETGRADPYAALKKRSNVTALGLEPAVRRVIKNAIRPFHMAVRFSIAGNIMDYALTSTWRPIDVDDFLEETRLESMPEEAFFEFHRAVKGAKHILFLADNAGETVFDRLLIEQFPEGVDTTYVVKQSPVINDATEEDACAVGLDRVAEIMTNGTDAPGTLLDQCSDAFMRHYKQADLVIAKGQANWESLQQAERPVWFLTRVKCPVIASRIERPLGSWQLLHHTGAGA